MDSRDIDVERPAEADGRSEPGEDPEAGGTASDGAPRPLAGTLVVDLSRYLPGPLAARLLADLGARVIKIEEPGLGDPVRESPPKKDGQSALATFLLAGHQSVALDLKKEKAQEVVGELLQQSDVLLESFRPGTLARMGLDPADLRRRFPSLVICSLSGWGQRGTAAHRAGHDLSYQAIAGSLASAAAMPGIQVADMLGAWSAVSSILAALLERQRTGLGRWIDQSLLDAAVHANLTGWAAEADGPKAVGEKLQLTGALPCYDVYRTRDGGLIALAALEPRFWRRFCQAAGCRDLLLRQYNGSAEVRHRLARLMATRTREEWARFMEEHDLPADPVLSLAEARNHPQVVERGVIQEGPDDLDRLAFPARFDGRRPAVGGAYPRLGEHTESLLEELGLEADLPRWRQRLAGIGRRFSWRRQLTRLAEKVIGSSRKEG